ncbi:MAG: amino acid permease [Candidatus Gastranaerophilales bacterium]|nr:amino acid permease [Candidatus Gastranaerophilales bacterium]
MQTPEENLLTQFISNILRKKNPDEFIEQSEKGGLKKTLNAFDLIILGISAVIGAGIFVIIGSAVIGTSERVGAGPALVISIFLAAIACIFPALCYAEFASMIPVSGSAYIYTYATMGELAAWMMGWILMLEYAIGTIAVASSWTGYLIKLFEGFPALPEIIKNPPVWLVNDYQSVIETMPDAVIPHFLGIPVCFNLPALFIITVIGLILLKGVEESTNFAKIMVFVKIAIISLFIIVGAFYVRPENWTPFVPFGIKGILMGAFAIFYAYIGFDAISTAAEETKNPQKNLPIGLICTLIICSTIYCLVTIVLTGMMPMSSIDLKAPIAYAMSFVGQGWFAGAISIGALAGLTSVLLVLQYGTTRILYAMARDGFLPPIMKKIHPKYNTPYVITVLSTILIMIGSLFINMQVAAELTIFGTFTSFIIVCIGILILRKTQPDRPRPFRVPCCPWFPITGIIFCSGLMFVALREVKTSATLFPLWIVIGIVIYFVYGYQSNRKQQNLKLQKIEEQIEIEKLPQ